MKIIRLNKLPPERRIEWGNGISRRLLLQQDKMKYSLTDTIIEAGSSSCMGYAHHLESCYCIEGEGTIQDEQGNIYDIEPGVLYALDKHDRHTLKAKTRMRLVCVFYPALVGNEIHQGLDEQYSAYPKLAKVIFVEASPAFQTVPELVRNLGFSPILFTNIKDLSFYENNAQENFDDVYEIDTTNSETMYGLVTALKMHVQGVLASLEDNVLSAALLAKKLSLPHPNISALKKTHNKHKVREILKKHHLDQVESKVFTFTNIPSNPPLKLPLIIKPIHDSGTHNCYLCNSLDDYSNAIIKTKNNRSTYTGLFSHNKILIEEYIDGDFYGAELLWHDNCWKIITIDKIFIDSKKSLCMTGISLPSDLPEYLLPTVEKEILNWINALKLKGGALNIEFKIVNNKPILIEINNRLAGAKVNRLIELAFGFSPLNYLIHWACTSNPQLYKLESKKNLYFADAFIFPFKNGSLIKNTIQNIDISKIDKHNLVEISLRNTPIEIKDDEINFKKIIGHVIASGKTCDEAMDNAVKIVEQIAFN